MRFPCEQSYALRLVGTVDGPLAGELEHVLSGERQAFGSGEQLLAALKRLRRQPNPADPPPRVPEP